MGFLTYGILCPFLPWASLAHLLSLGFLGPFTNFVFPWAFTDFIGLPRPNYFILILGIYGPAINPLLSLLALLWACHDPFLLFFHIIQCPWVCYLLFLSFRALLSPSASSMPIYLFHGLVIHYSCRLDLMIFVLCLLPTFLCFWVGLPFLHLGFTKKRHSTFSPLNIWSAPAAHMWIKNLFVPSTFLLSFPLRAFLKLWTSSHIYIYIYFFSYREQ